ncbi:MAG TPA: ScyD/ScyE family protein [Flavisolibacter sp.]|nr:ScyD/ScyE family protein [Flavisolibacter sp.]
MRTFLKVRSDKDATNAAVAEGSILKRRNKTKNVLTCFLALSFFAMVMPGCRREQVADKPSADQTKVAAKTMHGQNTLQGQLVAGLGGTTGSATGPGGYLFVPDSKAGTILQIDPKTGDYTIFASGLPQLIPEVDPRVGGVTDVAFRGGTAYALVTLVDDPLFPTGQVNGIYRIDGPNSYTIIADIGAFNVAHPPAGIEFEVATGVLYAIQTYRDGFLVTDGHLNRVLYVTLDGTIEIVRQFGDIVPTGLAVHGNQIYLSQAGPIPHLPENGKVVSFSLHSSTVTNVASGAPLLVDVETGRGQTLFALSQGIFSGGIPGNPALPNTGTLLRVNADGTFSIIADKLDIPTSMEIIGNTAYIITLTGEVWMVDNIAGPPFGQPNQKQLLHPHG